MRPTTNSEKFLLGLLALVILGGLVFFGGKTLMEKQRTVDLERASLRADNADAAVELQQEALWAKRAKWIRDHEPAAVEEGDARAQLLEFVVKGARDHHLEVQEQNLGGAAHGPGGTEVQSEVRVKGGMEPLCRWLAELEKPENFYAVQMFSLKADPDQKSMDCTLRISRYFREERK